MISIIIPYREDRGFLSQAIDSAGEQHVFGQGIEIVIQGGNALRGVNVNKAVRKAKGDYIKILDDDDILPPNALQDLWDGIQGFDWVCGNGQSFGLGDNLYIGRVPDLEGMLQLNHIHGGSTMYHRSCFEETGGFDETLWTCEEYDFHLKLMTRGYSVNWVDKTVHYYRIHEKCKSLVYNQTKNKERKLLREQIKDRYR